jgi:hypothetical protein
MAFIELYDKVDADFQMPIDQETQSWYNWGR